MAHEETEVVVVGAGPVGLMLAGELRLGGAQVTVLERLAEPMRESRASQLNARTMEIFDQRGLLDRLGTVRAEPSGHFGGIPLPVIDIGSAYAGYWKVPQPRTEAMLGAWAAELGADIQWDRELRGLTQTSEHVEAEVTGPRGSTRLRARYLVGCDGEGSLVRRLAGIEFTGHDARRELIRADVTGIDIQPRRFQRFPRGLAIAGRSGADVTRVMLHEFGSRAVERTAPPTYAEVVRSWARVTGEDIIGGTPIWIDVFGDVNRQAVQYRSDRVLLAGDAAHAQLPASGQALNLGVQDAANLGWKLAAQVRGWAAPGLLDSYHAERHPIGAEVLTTVAAQADLLLGNSDSAAVRSVFADLIRLDGTRRYLAETLGGLNVRYDVGPGDHPLLGARLPHGDVLTGGNRTTTGELLRPARGVLLDLAKDADGHDRIRATAQSWRHRVDTVPVKVDGSAALSGLTAALIRPDGHVAWLDPSPEELEPALRRWFGTPTTEAAAR
ncbi:MAG: oxidoreductase [Pseudonocardiales bacterium]|nr:MAG: oxidoreductase [Pseudonocardiales bacterium]